MHTELPSPILILGGAYAGKSEWSMDCLSRDLPATVIGTADAAQMGYRSRLNDLQAMRPSAWQTKESYHDLPIALLEACRDTDQVLIDSMNQWLAHIALNVDEQTAYEGRLIAAMGQVNELVGLLRDHKARRIVIVASEVGASPPPQRPAERLYRQLTGLATQAIAKECQTVVHLTAGLPHYLKGG